MWGPQKSSIRGYSGTSSSALVLSPAPAGLSKLTREPEFAQGSSIFVENQLGATYAAGPYDLGVIIKGFDMLTISAVIRVKKGHEETMRRALLEVAENVRVNEPGTVGFFVSQEQENPSVFTTYERFLDQAAMDAHNDSQVVARFFGIAKPILDGDVILVTSTEISAKI
jgi:quinol monooxygenase YgiN